MSRTNRAIQPSFSMKIFLTNRVKFFLIQDALVPKTVCLSIELGLKMTSENHLYLTGILFTVVESKELQQVHLGRI